MDDIVQAIKNFPDYIGSNGRMDSEITFAEHLLNTTFALDYKQYLKEIGLACFNGHELTGLTDDERLSVLAVTRQERGANKEIPESWYVVEQTNFDGIVIWQAPSGEIFQTVPGTAGHKLCNSLMKFISK
ncbi:SMI1/KNR4 family protein [Flintibacter sp.]|uniref:SMI1/KNR4 family protein n=1 Tax=Flintibacter sp. TaxID=1918624 RepID=UPI003D11663C|nr:SMI1/KNR4 family protein [Flintibacter sp.]